MLKKKTQKYNKFVQLWQIYSPQDLSPCSLSNVLLHQYTDCLPLKAYFQISYRGCSQTFQKLNILHPFVSLLQEGNSPNHFRVKNNRQDLISSDLCPKMMFLESLNTIYKLIWYSKAFQTRFQFKIPFTFIFLICNPDHSLIIIYCWHFSRICAGVYINVLNV